MEIAQLIDAYRAVGVHALAQVDLDVRQNRHQSLAALGPMAYAVLRAVVERLVREGRFDPSALSGDERFLVPLGGGVEERIVEAVERPPLQSLRAAAYVPGTIGVPVSKHQ